MTIGFKTRLTLGHAVAVAVILAVTAVAADWWLSRTVEGQIDAALVALAETEAASALDASEEGEPRVHLHELSSESGLPALRRLDKLVQLLDAQGQVIARGQTLGTATLPAGAALLDRMARGELVVETMPDWNGEPVRVVSLPIAWEGRTRYVLQVDTSLGPALTFVRTARLLFFGASLAILGGVVLIGALLTTRALAPIDRIVARAREIGGSRLSERLPHPRINDEIGRLVGTLNEMLDRIEQSFEVQRRFTADAAHELRSPLSRLRSELEITLRRVRGAEEYAGVLRSSLEEVERLGLVTEELLTLARLDAGQDTETPRAATALEPVVTETLARLVPTAEERQIRLVSAGSCDARVRVAPGLLDLVVGNLIENALKFSPDGGRVTVGAGCQDGEAVLAVSDSGPGVPADETSRIFDRFYRGRAAGSPDTSGVGLGLAIVRAIVESHGGTVRVESAPGAQGATFTVRLPLAV